MSSLTLKELLEAGTHFGHQTQRWNPKMKKFILCPKNGIHIIDLNKTITGLDVFLEKAKEVTAQGGKVLFVGTKKQIRSYLAEAAENCGMPYVTNRWLGGMLTNFKTIKKSIDKIADIEKMEADGTFEKLTKKESILLEKEKEKMLANLGGIREMTKPADMLFVIDTNKEDIAIAEARRLRIPVAGIVDTNSDPDPIDYPIPGNDDAIKSVKVIVDKISSEIKKSTEAIRIKQQKEGKEPAKPAASPSADATPKRRVVKKKPVESDA
ncbi:30S ribosomal protein S2 [Chitinivibrio alkaliphilus]|uniref:Small ribosomal subunit protein uS2 n=1 Tax=Chitinivibrio alkaliphilus ACht1 TaxID=1313304 RepID=U7D5T3_9BACT|nr:30S ribosomal protein S2 [Chitinivibrio alkaliphilus]ERP30916.1 30S ribosomal protein S2 [Chitinivibrio alkaliphilus ACht1]